MAAFVVFLTKSLTLPYMHMTFSEGDVAYFQKVASHRVEIPPVEMADLLFPIADPQLDWPFKPLRIVYRFARVLLNEAQATGMQPLSRTPIRGDYARHDWVRLARRLKVPFRLPAVHPVLSVTAGRAFQWLETEAEGSAVPFAKAMFNAAFGKGEDISETELVLGVAEALGANREKLMRARGLA